MSEDNYKESSHIADLLERDGNEASAQEIRDAIDIGSTATEILMQVRWRLRALQDAQAFKDEIAQLKVHRLLLELDLLLNNMVD